VYSHVKALERAGETDIPWGASTGGAAGGGGGRAESGGGSGGGKGASAASGAPQWAGKGRSALPPRPPAASGGPKIKQMAGGHVRTVSSTPAESQTKSYAFEKRKGVVNTMGGAKDLTRPEKEAALPGKGQSKGANIHGFVGLSGTGEGRVATRQVFGGEPKAKGGTANAAVAAARSKDPAVSAAPLRLPKDVTPLEGSDRLVHRAVVGGATAGVAGAKTVAKSADAMREARVAYFAARRSAAAKE
jgi:hypothetical protein